MLSLFFKPSLISACILSINCVAVDCFAILKTLSQSKNIDDMEELFGPSISQPRQTQMEREMNKNITRVAIVGDIAYWIESNIIYKAAVDDEGFIDKDGAKQIDVFKLSEKEVSNLLNIIDAINN